MIRDFQMEYYSGSSHRLTVIGAKGKWMSGKIIKE